MYWRRIAISSIPFNDPEVFDTWLVKQWRIKDELLEGYVENGNFPADQETGFIEAEVKLGHWLEIGQIFHGFTYLSICLVALGYFRWSR